MALANGLSIPIKHEKTCFPATVITVHGIELDTVKWEARLSQDKVQKLLSSLAAMRKSRSVTLHQLQSVIGLLTFASRVISPSRAFIRRLINLTARATGARQSTTVRYQWQHDSPQKEKMVASVYQTRSLGVPAKGLRDQVDSVMLLEEGFNIVSTDKMLKFALKERWRRRKEDVFDKWVIEEANWLSLSYDLSDVDGVPQGGFDAVLCLGNSFAHLPNFEGSIHNHKVALSNFRDMTKPGGSIVIDHRNFDEILTNGNVSVKNIYCASHCTTDIKVSNLYVNCRPTLTTFDYTLDLPKCNSGTGNGLPEDRCRCRGNF
ncbi:Glycine N-methyltransferase [Lamellibrachia satsuma]|nr:Glycine N-methyltransferase [Lamellibrachia satsuma]